MLMFEWMCLSKKALTVLRLYSDFERDKASHSTCMGIKSCIMSIQNLYGTECKI